MNEVITICASASFYRHVVEIQEELEKMGYRVLIPFTAEKMKQAQNYNLQGFKPKPEEVEWKSQLMHAHFDKVEEGDICFVVNDDKHGIKNYIGGNVLMEMTLAFRARKPIVILNDIPKESSFYEELMGMQPIILHGDIQKLTDGLTIKE